MNTLSPLGWILILFLVFLFIGINVSLFTSQKRKQNSDSWVNRIQEAGKTLRDPFRKEDEKLNKLSEKVKDLKQSPVKETYYGDKNERP